MEKKKRKKRHYKGNTKKKIIVLIILGTFLFVGMGFSILGLQFDIDGTLEVGKYDKTLYGTIRKEVKNGYALKYDGEHQDSMDSSKSTSDIYHYYAQRALVSNANKILEKNNVVFADTCWQMYRTTDTGGVRMIYNGEANKIENGDGTTSYNCVHTSSDKHKGPSGMRGVQGAFSINLNSNYIYSNTYTYDKDTAMFILDQDTKFEETWSDSTYKNLIEKYTCASQSDTCETLYKINQYVNSTTAYAARYKVEDVKYNYIGKSIYNEVVGSEIKMVGYMWGGAEYIQKTTDTTTRLYSSSYRLFNTSSLDTTFWYADSIDWDNTIPNNYSLINSYQVNSTSDYTNLVGKYTFRNTDQNYTDTSIYYIAAVNGNTMYYKKLSNGNLDISIRVADSMTETGELQDYTNPIELKDWYSNHNSYSGKYTCFDSSTSCSNPAYINSISSIDIYYIAGSITIGKSRNGLNLVDYKTVPFAKLYKENNTTYSDYFYTCNNTNSQCTKKNLHYMLKSGTTYSPALNRYYGKSVKWDDNINKYVLQDTVELDKIADPETMSTHHYTCIEIGENECEKVAYIYYVSDSGIGYILLSNKVEKVEDALKEMFETNRYNSSIKGIIDAWYEEHLKDTIYETKIDDTIYCNDRSYSSNPDYLFEKSGWNPNGGYNQDIYYKEYDKTTDLSCNKETDRFSNSNNKAKLTYKISLQTSPEYKLLNSVGFGQNSGEYWLNSPDYIRRVDYVNNEGKVGVWSVSPKGVRPVISLVKGTEYESGTGSTTDPYIVKMDE